MALAIGKLGAVSFIRENVAVALEYGYYKAMRKEFPAQGFTVLFCDMGMCCTTLTIVQYFNVATPCIVNSRTGWSSWEPIR